MNILSIQSWVAYGHVGNAAATFPLQRLGAEVWAVNTVQFSNHPGYGDWTGRLGSGAEVTALIDGIERRGAFARCDAVLSGYMGDVSVGDAVLDAAGRVRAANPDTLYCCDPVIGDTGKVYVRTGIPELIAERAVPQADVLTPNQFELERLSGVICRDRASVRQAIAALQGRMRPGGRRAVLLTSVVTAEAPPGLLEIVAADDAGTHVVRVPALEVGASGAGDAMAALFLFHLIRTGWAAEAMASAASAVHAVLSVTAARGGRDLLLVEAQDAIVSPPVMFQIEEF